MKKFLWALLAVLLIPKYGTSAELYKYVDKDGVTHITDSIGQMPVDQRDRSPVKESPTQKNEKVKTLLRLKKE